MKTILRPSIAFALVLCTATHVARGQGDSGSPPPADQPIPPETLDKLLAPIALYPDALILQIVQCAASPFEVKQVSEWLKKHADLKGTAVQDAASKEGFDASFVAIVLFPQVVQMMADQPDWTRQIGEAFTKDRKGVFDSIQRLRKQAESVGNLKTTEQQQVQTVTTSSGQQVIVVQPANPQVVYVPVYNPTVVYTQPAPTTSTQSSGSSAGTAALLGFAAGVIVGAAADDDDHHYYYGCGGWGYHGGLCEEGWDDYYDHREDMAAQRGENQSNRQDARNENQATRQDQQSQNQATRQENQSTRQSTASSAKTSRGTTTSRASGEGVSRSGTSSGAFSGYQRGSTERASSERGRGSMSGRSGGGGRHGRR